MFFVDPFTSLQLERAVLEGTHEPATFLLHFYKQWGRLREADPLAGPLLVPLNKPESLFHPFKSLASCDGATGTLKQPTHTVCNASLSVTRLVACHLAPE